jgi:ribonuclease P protein component
VREPQFAGNIENRPPTLTRLKKRAEFLNAAKGQRFHSRCFSLQVVRRANYDSPAPRFGFTVTKKLGNAVVRNRIRRRLKEALRQLPGLSVQPGHDYVIVARQAALREAFLALQGELSRALAEIHAHTTRNTRPPRSRPSAATISTCAAKKTKD